MFSLKTSLALLFAFFTFSVVFAGPPMPMPMPKNQVVSQEGCVVLHPESLPWKQPKEANWLGSCVSGKAQGYGWYKFNLTSDGYPASTVEIFLELENGSLTNDFYFAKMMTGKELNYEGYAQASGYQVDNGNCLALAACYRTMQALKEKTTSPKPPVPPVAPEESEENSSETPVLAAISKLAEVIYGPVLERAQIVFADEPEKITQIEFKLSTFESYYNEYAINICRRNSRDLRNCQIYQFHVAAAALENLANGESGESTLFKLQRSYKPFEESNCAGRSNMQDLFNCIRVEIQKKEKIIAAKYPREMEAGAIAIAEYSEVLSLLEGSEGSAKTGEYLWAYERLLEFIYQQSITPWKD